MGQFDDRIFKVVLTWGTESLTLDGGLDIHATGTKFANALQDTCTVTIANLKRATRDALATQLTPFNFNQARKSMQLYAGRVSTGLALIYQGDITQATPSQPPDIILTIEAKTGQFYKYDLVAQAQAVTAPLSQIATGIAATMGLSTRFEATDRNISNYSFTGPTVKQVDKLVSVGGVTAFVDGDTLVVKDAGVALSNEVHLVSMDTGMVGVPQLTEYGVRVSCMFEPYSKLGGALRLTSILNPSLNGDYIIYKLAWDLASRDTPFYSILEASKFPVLSQSANLPQ